MDTGVKKEKVEKFYKDANDLLKIIEGNIGKQSALTIDSDFLNNGSIFARFHTHPLDDGEYFPSQMDAANTHVIGPSVLISKKDGVLHVYAINRGNSREIYTKNR